MRTAVDSSILLDVLGQDPRFGEASRRALREAFQRGSLLACEVVWSEVRAHFPDAVTFRQAFLTLGLRFDPLLPETAESAGALWRSYCLNRGRKRDRVIADFLIGAHALHQADALLSRDRGFYREAFQDLQLIDPSQG